MGVLREFTPVLGGCGRMGFGVERVKNAPQDGRFEGREIRLTLANPDRMFYDRDVSNA
jgi:hypothetical protein